jgi:hypothetical protein
LSRFNRTNTESGELGTLVGTAADELRSTLERQVGAILDVVEARAAQIEQEAEQNAARRERDSEARANELTEAVLARAWRVLDSIELVQNALSGMLGDLRAELESRTGGRPLEAAPDSPGGLPESAQEKAPAPTATGTVAEEPAPIATSSGVEEQPPPPTPNSTGVHEESHAKTPGSPSVDEKDLSSPESALDDAKPLGEEDRPEPLLRPVPLKLIDEPAADADSAAEFDQMILAEVKGMFRSGSTRAEVEGFLKRFRLGNHYLKMLDQIEIEAMKAPQRRRPGLLWRRRPRTR